MSRHLVVYYSWTGNTKKVAKAVADRLGADLEEVVEQRPYSGPFARFLHALDSILRRKPPIASAKRDVGNYDAVILGSPVWAADMAAPMRAFLAREKGRIGRAAFFCTQGGFGGETALESMANASGAEPLSILLLSEGEMKGFAWRSNVDSFVESIENAMSLRQRTSEAAGQLSEETQGPTRITPDGRVGGAPP